MPYVSSKQRSYFHAAAARGDINKKTVKRWDVMSKGLKLPEHVKHTKQASETMSMMEAFADELVGLVG